jgi:hypothetical protein
MKKLFTTLALLAIIGLSANAQGLQWNKNWDSNPGHSQTDQGYAITTDASGNVYVTGAAFDNSTTASYIETIKYSSTGNIVWSTATTAASAKNIGFAIAVDNHGNTWVTGTAYNTSTYGNNLILLKYSPSGHLRPYYPKFYQVNSGSYVSRGTCLAVVDSTDVYVGGSVYDNNRGTWALWVGKDNSGASGWSWTYTKTGTGTSSVHSATDIKANSSDVWVTGFINNGTSSGEDCWTAELNTSGTYQWGIAYTGSGAYSDEANAMCVDGSANVWIVGYTTNSTTGKDALIVDYTYIGTTVTQTWYEAFNNPTYNLDEVFTDVALGVKCGSSGTLIYAGGYIEKGTGNNYDYDYMLAAYDNTAQARTSLWSQNPVYYNGTHSLPQAFGTDQGYSVAYSSTTDRVYITGRSDETSGGINITTIGYASCSGSKVWSASYNYNSSQPVNKDEMFWKYGMAVVNYNICGDPYDDIYIEGESYVTNNDFDYITLHYSCLSCIPCGMDTAVGRLSHTGYEVQTGLYPNPFSTSAMLSINPSTQINNAVLSVYDIAGRLVTSVTNITKNNIVINRGNLKNGLYYYTLTDNGNIISKGKFIITE